MAAGGTYRSRQLHDVFCKEELARRPEVRFINTYAAVRAYNLMLLKGIGALLLLWATVVLLGGFVSSLQKKDFLCISFISFVQAAGILNAVFEQQLKHLAEWLISAMAKIFLPVCGGILIKFFFPGYARESHGQSWPSKVAAIIVFIVLYPVVMFFAYGLLICAGLSYWRVTQPDYGSGNTDANQGNLKPGMDLFYFLCIAQGLMYLILIPADVFVITPILEKLVGQRLGLRRKDIQGYCLTTKRKYLKDLASSDESWNLVTYGAGLLDSEMPEHNVSGARVLAKLIDQGVPIGRQLLRSPRDRIQKLIGSLAWTSPAEREMRKLAARIVEHIARDLKLAQFPGALECISSLVDSSSDDDYDDMDCDEDAAVSFVNKQQGEDMVPSNEDLMLQGLRILEILALDKHNCEVICSSDVLYLKIVAPVSCKRLIQDSETRHAWIEVTHGSLKLISQLMRCPGDTGKVMRSKIANTSRAVVNNLEEVLALEISSRDVIVLQTRAIEILEQLYSGESTSTHWPRERRENLCMKVLPIFLSDKWMEDYLSKARAEVDEEVENKNAERKKSGKNRQELEENKMKEAQNAATQLMEKAGEALATLSMGNQIRSDYIRSFTGYGDVVHCLTDMLDSDERTTKCRYSAAVVLKHLCTHCTTLDDHGYLKEVTIKKVLQLIKTASQATSTNNTSLHKHISITQSGGDIENPAAQDGHDKRLPEQVSKQKQQHEERKLQVALVSLCAAIRRRCIDAPDFASVVAQLVSPKDRAEKLKNTVEQIVNSK